MSEKTTAVAAHARDVGGIWASEYHITVNGARIEKCFNFNEAEGWADVWLLDENGIPLRKQGSYELAHTHLTGEVLLVADTPEIRAWFEKHYPASACVEVKA